MSIEKNKGFFTLECDICNEKTKKETLQQIRDERKNNFWEIKKHKVAYYLDICPDCKNKE